MAARKTAAAGAKPDKLMRGALILALNREAEEAGKKTKRLHVIANALVKKAMTGSVDAIKEIADRVDGKATQPIEHDVSDTVEAFLDRIASATEGAGEA